jgi:uncharacterized protein YabE (DUF348 family)
VAVRPVAAAVAVAVLWGGHAAWEATAKTVALTVDGKTQQVRTHGSTVADVLDAAGVRVAEHDLLAPSPDVTLTATTSVVLRHGRLVSLTVDGAAREVWVTAMSVSEALDQIGLRADGAVLSADRSRPIPLKGFSLDVRTRKGIQLLDGGRVRRVATNGLTVQDLLTEQRLTVRPTDRIAPATTAPLRDGMVVRLTRVDGKRLVDTVPIAYSTVRRPDASMYRGDTKVLRSGRVGTLRRTFALRYVNGKLAGKKLVTSVRVAAPVAKIVAYGTKKRAYSVAGADHLNWYALARCESGNNPRAVSSGGTYRGLYQFTLGTWHNLGGKGDPINASREEQTYRAKLLYKQRGSSPWPSCGRLLYS